MGSDNKINTVKDSDNRYDTLANNISIFSYYGHKQPKKYCQSRTLRHCV